MTKQSRTTDHPDDRTSLILAAGQHYGRQAAAEYVIAHTDLPAVIAIELLADPIYGRALQAEAGAADVMESMRSMRASHCLELMGAA